MKQTFLNIKLDGLTAMLTSQRYEVLFFSTAHFLFFNLFANCTKHTFIFLPTLKPNKEKKMKECFCPSLSFYICNIIQPIKICTLTHFIH